MCGHACRSFGMGSPDTWLSMEPNRPYRQLGVLIALLLLILSNVCQTATVPVRTCRPNLLRTLYQLYRECATKLPEYSLKNTSSLSVPSDNLLRMHGEEFPYQMRLSSMGVVFSNFEQGLPVPNPVVRTLLQQAGAKLELRLALNPSLETEPMREQAIYVEEDNHRLMLAIEPRIPRMTYGDQYALIAVLASWVMQYESVECRMVVWAWPGMRQQRRLGTAHIVLQG